MTEEKRHEVTLSFSGAAFKELQSDIGMKKAMDNLYGFPDIILLGVIVAINDGKNLINIKSTLEAATTEETT